MKESEREKFHEAVVEAEIELDIARGKYLRAHGWEYSSSHPDCVWRWSKIINGKNYSLSAKEAIHMEECI